MLARISVIAGRHPSDDYRAAFGQCAAQTLRIDGLYRETHIIKGALPQHAR